MTEPNSITCCEPDCGAQFIFTVDEQKVLLEKRLHAPQAVQGMP